MYNEDQEDPLKSKGMKQEANTSGTKVHTEALSLVVQELVKALNMKQGDQGNIKNSSGFAGTVISSNVSNVFNVIIKKNLVN